MNDNKHDLVVQLAPVGDSKEKNTSIQKKENCKEEKVTENTKASVPKHLNNLALNTHKAGMKGLDANKINEIIQKASEGSRFYTHKQAAQQKLDSKIQDMLHTAKAFSPAQLKHANDQMQETAAVYSAERDLTHTIVHVDMDMFYAAVEMRDQPSLRDVPMAVGGMGMLSTSNYEARKYGVRAAMPGFIALKLCQNLVIVPTNFEKYKAVSKVVGEVFALYDPNYSMMSLDEAYLDITPYLAANGHLYQVPTPSPRSMDDSAGLEDSVEPGGAGNTLAEIVVKEMRDKIQQATQLTASAGIAANTRLAKVGSDLNKPNGQYYLPPDEHVIAAFMENLPIRKICGVGNVMEQHLRALDITQCGQLRANYGLLQLLLSEGTAEHFVRVSLGLGQTDISDMAAGERKSISCETTFSGTRDKQYFLDTIKALCEDLHKDMVRKNIFGKTFTLKMKTVEFALKTRSQCLGEPTQDLDVMFSTSKRILLSEMEKCPPDQPLALRLLGIRMSLLLDSNESEPKQMTISKMIQMISSTQKSTSNSAAILSDEPQNTVSASDSCTIPSHNSDSIPDKLSLPPKYICPICEQSILTKFLGTFNNHIDQCLRKSDVNDSVSIDRRSPESSSNYLSPTSLKSNYSNCKKNTASSAKKSSVYPTKLLVTSDKLPENKSYFTESKQSSAGKNVAELICPVCSVTKFTCPVKLNLHLDECLSLQELEQIKKSSTATQNRDESINNPTPSPFLTVGQKRKNASDDRNSCRKKVKPCNTIKNYFS